MGIQLERQAFDLVNSTGRFDNVLELFKKACEINPKRSAAFYNRAVVEEHLGMWDQAVRDFNEAIALDPNNPKIAIEFARSCAIAGCTRQLDETIEAHKLKPAEKPVKDQEINGVLIMSCDKRAIADPSIIQQAADSELIVGIINSSAHNEVQSASILLNELKKRKPDDAATLAMEGWVLIQQAKYVEAFRSLEESERMCSESPVVKMGMEICRMKAQSSKDVFFKASLFNDKNSAGLPDHRNFESRNMPIVVHIQSLRTITEKWTIPPDPNIDYDKCIEQACSDWAKVSDSKVSFKIMKNSRFPGNEKSSILLTFVADYDNGKLATKESVGWTQLIRANPEGSSLCLMTLVVPTKTGPDNSRLFYECVTHEFGHALGLGHSPLPDDIMFYSLHGPLAHSLSRNDEERLQKLYSSGGSVF